MKDHVNSRYYINYLSLLSINHYLSSNIIRNFVHQFLPLVLLFLRALLLTVVGLLCIVLLSCVYF